MMQASKDIQAEDRRLTECHARDREKTLRQYEVVVDDHHQEVRSLRERAEEVEKATANIEDRLETIFSRSRLIAQLVRAPSAVFGQFLKGSFQNFSRDLNKSLDGYWHKLYRMFSTFCFDQDYGLETKFVVLRVLTGDSADTADLETKRTGVHDPPSGSDLFISMLLLVHSLPSYLISVWFVRVSHQPQGGRTCHRSRQQ